MADEPRPPAPSPAGWRRLARPRIVLGAVALVLVVWFAVANSQRVTVDWFLVETSSPLFLVILLAAVLGALADRLIRWRRARRPPPGQR
jgi:uncharacterized integral membrane protein